MTAEEQVISLFERQKEKIKTLKPSTEEFWKEDTCQLIDKYIGREFYQYDKIKGHVFKPNGDNETVKSQRERGAGMIDSCIGQIKAFGIKKELRETEIAPVVNNYNSNTSYGGNAYQDLSQDNSQKIETTNTTTLSTISNKPTNEKWQLWVGIVAVIVAILTGLKTCGYL